MNNQKLLEIFTLGLLWGPSFLFTRIAVQEIQPLTFVSLRVGLAALLLFLILKLKKINLPRNSQLWKDCFILGFLTNGLPLICFAYALLHVPSSLGALINGLTPVTTVFLAHFFLHDEPLSWRASAGITVSLLGFLVLFLPTVLDLKIQLDSLGILLSFIAASAYGIGIVYAKRARAVQAAKPFVVPTVQLISSLIYLIPLILIFDTPGRLVQVSLTAWGCVFGISVLGTVLAYTLYYRIVARYGATALSTVCYLLPVFGALFGVVFLKEAIGWDFCIAAVLILSGVMLVNSK